MSSHSILSLLRHFHVRLLGDGLLGLFLRRKNRGRIWQHPREEHSDRTIKIFKVSVHLLYYKIIPNHRKSMEDALDLGALEAKLQTSNWISG